jgi:hypothetical protein
MAEEACQCNNLQIRNGEASVEQPLDMMELT